MADHLIVAGEAIHLIVIVPIDTLLLGGGDDPLLLEDTHLIVVGEDTHLIEGGVVHLLGGAAHLIVEGYDHLTIDVIDTLLDIVGVAVEVGTVIIEGHLTTECPALTVVPTIL